MKIRKIILQDNFQLLQELGSGGYGFVYSAILIDNKNFYGVEKGKKYAIKFIEENRFRENEYEVSKLIKYLNGFKCNENILCFYDIFKTTIDKKTISEDNLINKYNDKEYTCILMEYIEGYDVSQYIRVLKKENLKLDFKLLIKFIKLLSKAVYFLHKNDIVHRDIKPANIKYNGDNLKLIDLGMTCSLTIKDKNYQCRKRISGTRDYFPPEIKDKENFEEAYDHNLELLKAGDMWAVGITFYYLINKTKEISKKEINLENLEDYDIGKVKIINKMLVRLLNENPDKRITSFELLKLSMKL
jgi:serine/threonine protein kinase